MALFLCFTAVIVIGWQYVAGMPAFPELTRLASLTTAAQTTRASIQSVTPERVHMWENQFFTNLVSDPRIVAAVNAYNPTRVDKCLIYALMWEESSFNPRAYNANTNGSADRGLFQLNSHVYTDVPIADFYNIDKNVRMGIAHFANEAKSFANEHQALAAYNGGPQRAWSSSVSGYASDVLAKKLEIEIKLQQFLNAKILQGV